MNYVVLRCNTTLSATHACSLSMRQRFRGREGRTPKWQREARIEEQKEDLRGRERHITFKGQGDIPRKLNWSTSPLEPQA